jgi:uncharacterized protein
MRGGTRESRMKRYSLRQLVGGAASAWLMACGGAGARTPTSGSPADTGDAATDAGCAVTEAGVSVQVEGGTLHGTATTLGACAPKSASLIVAGSGPVDRNGNAAPSLVTDAYAELSAHLASRGVASIRYDKRGVGESEAAGPVEQNLTFDIYVDDARGWVRWMRQNLPSAPIVITGHSEGSLIGILAAETETVDGLISLEGAGRPAGEVLRQQLAAQLSSTDYATASMIIDQLEAGQTVASVPSILASVFRPSVQPYLISWFKYDPAKEMAKLSLPVLIVQGTEDLQTGMVDANLLAGAARNGTLAVVVGMAHTLKVFDPADPRETKAYTDPSLPLAPGFLTALDGFEGKWH